MTTSQHFTRAQAWSVISRAITTIEMRAGEQTEALRDDLTRLRDQFFASITTLPEYEFDLLDTFIATARRADVNLMKVNAAYDALHTLRERFVNQRRLIQMPPLLADSARDHTLNDLETRIRSMLVASFEDGKSVGKRHEVDNAEAFSVAASRAQDIIKHLREKK